MDGTTPEYVVRAISDRQINEVRIMGLPVSPHGLQLLVKCHQANISLKRYT